jgi:hypothetical protein
VSESLSQYLERLIREHTDEAHPLALANYIAGKLVEDGWIIIDESDGPAADDSFFKSPTGRRRR